MHSRALHIWRTKRSANNVTSKSGAGPNANGAPLAERAVDVSDRPTGQNRCTKLALKTLMWVLSPVWRDQVYSPRRPFLPPLKNHWAPTPVFQVF
jgi:hypothetical protein